MVERNNFQNNERYESQELTEIANERSKEIAHEKEQTKEIHNDNDVEAARHEALEQATKHERELTPSESDASPEKPTRATKRQKDASFDATMSEIRTHMSGPSRQFSKVIHNKGIERASDMIGGTIARPNAILSGSLFAFLFTLGIYLIARFNGYPLSGTETIAAFILGWIVGIVYDYLRLIITGKK